MRVKVHQNLLKDQPWSVTNLEPGHADRGHVVAKAQKVWLRNCVFLGTGFVEGDLISMTNFFDRTSGLEIGHFQAEDAVGGWHKGHDFTYNHQRAEFTRDVSGLVVTDAPWCVFSGEVKACAAETC